MPKFRGVRSLRELTAAELLDIRASRDPLPALRHTVEVFATEYADHHAITASEHFYGPGITTGLTWGHLRALLSELEMYRSGDADVEQENNPRFTDLERNVLAEYLAGESFDPDWYPGGTPKEWAAVVRAMRKLWRLAGAETGQGD